MRFALSIEIQEGMTYAETLAMAKAGEDLGYDSALLAEHYYPSGVRERYRHEPISSDAWIYLGALARDTSTIKLGTLVSPVTFRHPAVLAKMAATLDHVSGGRAELGMGAGWLAAEHEAFGFAFPEPPRRVDILEEQLQIVTGLLTSEAPFSHAGKHYRLENAAFTPKPRAKIPIILGGSSTATRLPKLAARYADEYVVNSPSLDQCRSARQRLDAACEQIGRDPTTVHLSAFLAICVGQTEADLARAMAEYERNNPQYVRMLDRRPNWIFGTPTQAAEQLHALAQAGVERALVSVNADVHLKMLPLLRV